jgi:DNA-binding GntR family transcriptional regulator
MRLSTASDILAPVSAQPTLTPRRAVELREIHRALEPIAAQRWVESADDEALERLHASFERVRVLVEAGAGPDLIRRAKDRFFIVLFRSTASVVPDSLLSIEPSTRVVRRASIAHPDRPPRMLTELQAILDAAAARNEVALAAACTRHIDNEFSSGLSALVSAS